MLANVASHARAAAVEHAIDLLDGTVVAALCCGKCDSKIARYQYPSLVVGVWTGKTWGACCIWRSVTCVSTCAFSPSIQL